MFLGCSFIPLGMQAHVCTHGQRPALRSLSGIAGCVFWVRLRCLWGPPSPGRWQHGPQEPGALDHPCPHPFLVLFSTPAGPDPPPLGAAPCPLLGCVPGASVDSKLQGRDQRMPPPALGGGLSHLFMLPAGPQGSRMPVTAGTGDPTSTLILCRARPGPVEKLYMKDATSSFREALKAGLCCVCMCVCAHVCLHLRRLSGQLRANGALGEVPPSPPASQTPLGSSPPSSSLPLSSYPVSRLTQGLARGEMLKGSSLGVRSLLARETQEGATAGTGTQSHCPSAALSV